MGEERRLTRSQRMSLLMLPWIEEVVNLDETVTAREVLRRLSEKNGPTRRIGGNPSAGSYRTIKHLPSVSGMAHLLKISTSFVKHGTGSPIQWRRIK